MTWKVSGISRNNAGAVLASCECFLFKYNSTTHIFTQTGSMVTSDGSGAFSFTGLTDNASSYCVAFFKNGTPNVFDITDRNLTPVVEAGGGGLTPVLWLDASDPAFRTASGGGSGGAGAGIVQWRDKSPSAYVFNAPAGGGPVGPVLRLALKNGLDILDFTGGSVDPGVGFDCASVNIPQPFTVFIVMKAFVSAFRFLWDSTTGSNRNTLLWSTAPTVGLVIGGGTNLEGPTQPPDTYFVGTCIYNGASSQIRINDVLDINGNGGTLGIVAGDGMRLGQRYSPTGSGFDNELAELRIYPGVLSSTDITATVTALKTKWGIP